MSTKNYGPATSGYRDPEGRAWETTVFEAGKPVLDVELNLSQDAEQEAVSKLARKTFPSGWLSDAFLNSSQPSVFAAVVNTANVLSLNALSAYVNGWLINVTNTGVNTGLNNLTLTAGPTGAGSKRTDLVVLEVWRRLLSPASSTVGKSPAGRIWRNGNVKVASGDDMTLNYADDILDANVGSETTKRVQVQYRLRVIPGVDLFTNPFGMNDPAVVANTVPATAAAPDGTATVYTYTNQSTSGDPGLWRAGNGDPTNTLGTVDGYMYAIPLCAVFRRNTTAFARNTNHNGGVAYPGPSDRPDGLFRDILVDRDVFDMRNGTSPTGWDLTEVTNKNLNFLFDNVTQTEIGETLLGNGVQGPTLLWADEIGISNANGGDGTTTGDTPGAEFIGEFDAARRSFSDKVIYETVVLRYTPPGVTWQPNDVVNITPSALPIWPYSSFNWAASAPSNVSIVSINRVAHIGEATGQNTRDITAESFWSVTGLGQVPQGNIQLKLTTAVGGAAPLYVTVTIAYPAGVGLTKTPTTVFADNSNISSVSGVVINNPGQLPSSAPILYSSLTTPVFNKPNRELTLTYNTVSHTRNYYATTGFPSPKDTIYLPERAKSGTISMTINATPYGGPITLSADGYSFGITPTVFNSSDAIVITYQSVRPLPKNGEQLTVYYEARAPQTIRAGVLGTSLSVVPRHASNNLFVLTTGSGSDGEAYPFPTQYVQVGGVYPGSGGSFDGDHELDGDLRVSTTSLFLDTGFAQLMARLPVVPSPESLTFTRSGGDVDLEGRSYFPTISGSYKPFSVAEVLSDPKKHKNVLPLLCELAADGPVGFKGQLVLVVLSRWAAYDDENSILFNPTASANTTTASIYRLKGNLLSNRRS
jgi:hypothetical protein